MKIKKDGSSLLKPDYQNAAVPPTDLSIPLTAFDTATYKGHVAVIYAYKPPTPPNTTIKQGLRKVLAHYRELAGRLVGGEQDGSHHHILLNDEGLRFVEASSEYPLSHMGRPSSHYLDLHPPIRGIDELAQVQLTRFSCGSLVVGFTSHHFVADGLAIGHFLVAWGRAVRGLPIEPPPFRNRTIFNLPRNPPQFRADHAGVEYVDKWSASSHCSKLVSAPEETIVVHNVHFPSEFLVFLKAKASMNNSHRQPYSTVSSLVAHLWRSISLARRLDESEPTQVRIAVNGRGRMNRPLVPLQQYFGNLVLWALPRSNMRDLLHKPLSHAARLIDDSIARVNDDYFCSFIDFSSSKEKMEGLVPSANYTNRVLSPNLEVYSWLGIPFYDTDFGGGCPYMFTPSYFCEEGTVFLLPSFTGNGDIDVFIALFEKDVDAFEEICYSLE